MQKLSNYVYLIPGSYQQQPPQNARIFREIHPKLVTFNDPYNQYSLASTLPTIIL